MNKIRIIITLIHIAVFSTSVYCQTKGVAISDPERIDNKHQTIQIQVQKDDARPNDSLFLYYYDHLLSNATKTQFPHTTVKLYADKKGVFKCEIPNPLHPLYFSLMEAAKEGSTRLEILSMYLMEPGDNLLVKIEFDSLYNPENDLINTTNGRRPILLVRPELKYSLQYKIYFFGAEAAKYKCIQEIAKENEDSSKINILNKYKDKISPLAFDILKTDLLSEISLRVYIYFYQKAYPYHEDNNIDNINTLKKEYLYSSKLVIQPKVSPLVKLISKNFPLSILYKARAEYKIFHKEKYPNFYSYLKGLYTGEMRDKLIVMYFYESLKLLEDSIHIKDNALSTVKSKFYLDILKNMIYNIKTGSAAFKFSLPDINGNIRTLKEFKGKIIFMDFWFTGCGACQKYYKYELSKAEEEFKNDTNVVFITVSIDQDKHKWTESIKSGNYTSPDIINLFTGGRGSDDPIITHYQIFGYPQPIVIDRRGLIYRYNGTDLRDGEKLIQTIKSAKLANPG